MINYDFRQPWEDFGNAIIVRACDDYVQALKELKKPLYDENMMSDYIGHIKRVLGITDEEFDMIMNSPTHMHEDFKESSFLKIKKAVRKRAGRL